MTKATELIPGGGVVWGGIIGRTLCFLLTVGKVGEKRETTGILH